MLKSFIFRTLLILTLGCLIGCSCMPPSQPPQTMLAGMVDYGFNRVLVPKLGRAGAQDGAKCFLVPVKNESSYTTHRNLTKMCDDLFETAIFDAGYKVAAKEAVESVARRVGAIPLERLFEPDMQDQFKQAIKQEGVSIVDYMFLIRLTGVPPSLSIQGKIICTKAGPDFGQQIPGWAEINWKNIWCDYQDETTAGEWAKRITRENL